MEPSEKTARNGEPKLGRDLFMVLLAVLSIVLLVYDEVRHPSGQARSTLVLLDLAIVVVFLIEYLYRLWQADDRKAFLRRNWFEIPGMVPMLVGEASFLRVFRLARIFRIVRILRVVSILGRFQRLNRLAGSFLRRSHLLTTATVASTVILAGAFAAWVFEHPTNPQFARFQDALWWAIVTASTVGYGDIVPQTGWGRAVGALLMVTGVGLIGTLAATIATALARPGPADATLARRPLEERLGDVARLHAAGALSDEEFQAAKERLLREA